MGDDDRRPREPRDPFEEGREAAEELRLEFEGLRDDVRAVVRQEVERVGLSPSELERMVDRMVERRVRERLREGSERRRATASGPGWSGVALVAAGVVVGLVAGTAGYRFVAGPAAGTEPSPVSTRASADTTAGPPEPAEASVPAPTPFERAALYDSLFEARSSRLGGLLARLESAGPVAPVGEALSTWRAGSPLPEEQRRRLHDALVQLALNEVAAAGLTLDGLVSRGPCRGNSCGALLRVWEERGSELGLPAFPTDAARNDSTLAVAERALVVAVMESGEGSAPTGGPGEGGR